MSSHISLAQRIHSDILQSIIQYTVHGVMLPSGQLEAKKDKVKELLYVSSSWRIAALEFMWKKLSLTIDGDVNKVLVNNIAWAKHFKLPNNAIHMIREINIMVPMYTVVNGKALRLLKEYMGNTQVLPLVHKLSVEFTICMIGCGRPMDSAISNTIEFAQLIRTVIEPLTTTTRVKCAGESWQVESFEEEVFGVFTNSLCSNTKSAMLSLKLMDFEFLSTVDIIPLLSSLEMHCESTVNSCASIIYKCAATLADLSVCTRNTNALFYDADGGAVVYPNLKSFRIFSNVMAGPFERRVAPAIVPFPNLKTLLICERYPFGDDVPFRGNNNTLEHVGTALDSRTVIMLNKSRVFEYKYTCLRRVVILEDDVSCDLSDVPEATMKEFLRKLTGTVHALGFMSEIAASTISLATPHIRSFENIQVLDVRHTLLSLFQVLNLLKVLPSLRKLGSTMNGLGSEFNDMDSAKLPDHIATTYCNTGKHLHTLLLNRHSSLSSVPVAECIMLLALACPKFYQIYLAPGDALDYQKKVAKALRSGPYSKYTLQLRRFLNATDLLSSSESKKGRNIYHILQAIQGRFKTIHQAISGPTGDSGTE